MTKKQARAFAAQLAASLMKNAVYSSAPIGLFLTSPSKQDEKLVRDSCVELIEELTQRGEKS